MLTNQNLQALAKTRLDDAILLYNNKRYSAAYYLAGYAVELALKACIAKAFQPNAIPDKAFVNNIYTHNLQNLLGVSGLTTQFKADTRDNPRLATAWATVSGWKEDSRYRMWENSAASSLINAIKDKEHGVLQWLKKHW